jgi:hypothetical protein
MDSIQGRGDGASRPNAATFYVTTVHQDGNARASNERDLIGSNDN